MIRLSFLAHLAGVVSCLLLLWCVFFSRHRALGLDTRRSILFLTAFLGTINLSGLFQNRTAAWVEGFKDYAVILMPFTWLFLIYSVVEDNKKKELRDSEERMRLLVESTEDVIVMMDLEGRYLYYNGPERYGFKPEDVIGKTASDLHDPATAEDIMDRVRTVVRTGRSVTRETRMQIGDEVLWFLDQNSPMKDSMGNTIGISVICRNITDVKKAEDGLKASLKEKEILLKEIHHRVKNNLQAISGILNLQAHQARDAGHGDLYRKSQERVLSIALIHENLYRTRDLERVDIARYIGDLAGNLIASYGNQCGVVELDLQVEPANMVMDTAIPVGLILNELISNSLKHAFPDDRSGNLRVEFKALDQKRYLLTVSDDGIGFPDCIGPPEGDRTLGMKLVRLLVDQLGGSLTITRGPGTTFHIAFSEYREAGTALA